MRFPGIKSLGIRLLAILAGTDRLCGIITTITTGINPFTGISVHRSGCFRIRPQDLGHFSEYGDPAFDRIGIDSGIQDEILEYRR